MGGVGFLSHMFLLVSRASDEASSQFQVYLRCLGTCLGKALEGAFNQEKALVGAFSVIVQPVVEPMDRFAALIGGNAAWK